MGAASNNLTSILKRNLHVTPRGLEHVRMSVPIWIDTVANPLAAADYKILTIEAQTMVFGTVNGFLIVQTIETDADTISVGDVSAANYWLVATTVGILGMTPFTGLGKYYATANEVQITASAAITAAKFWILINLQYLNAA